MTLLSVVQVGIIGIAGALGALARYLLGRFIAARASRAGTLFPLGTFFINITGAFVIGLIFALVGRNLISTTLQVILATGFLGGYTTFSTMSWEGVELGRGGGTRLSILYLGSSLLLGLVAATIGVVLGGWL